MLTTKLIHPEILGALGKLGHGSKILIADGNYPFLTGSHASAQRVYLNLTPGTVSVTEVLSVLAQSIPIEAATVMMPDSKSEPPIFEEFRRILPREVAIKLLSRSEFYDAARDSNAGLVIATGEQRIYGNIMLSVGLVLPA